MTRTFPGLKRILIKYVEPEKKSGLIIIPDVAQDRDIVESTIVNIPYLDRKANEDKLFLNVGDTVLFMREAVAEIEIREEKYFLTHQDNILAVIRE